MVRGKSLCLYPEGHTFRKSSKCPVCPVCEELSKPEDGFLSMIPAPARRALIGEGITSLEKLAEFSENELLALHGFGPGSLPKLRMALDTRKLAFRKHH